MNLSTGRELSSADYAALAAFRHELRRFMSFSEKAAATAGIPVQQHQALLAIAGYDRPEPPAVGYIAEQLLVAPHTAAELVARMVEAGLVAKAVSLRDSRRIEISLTEKAKGLLAELTPAHLAELTNLEPALTQVLRRFNFK